MRWTTADLDLLPDTDDRYKIIDGELLVTRSPHWNHQKLCLRLGSALDAWCLEMGQGQTGLAPGIIFRDSDAVIPDVTWISQERYEIGLDAAGHLTVAPEVVEVLSEGTDSIRRDRDLKLRLYSTRGSLNIGSSIGDCNRSRSIVEFRPS